MNIPPLKITLLGTGTSTGVPMIGCHCDVCTSTDSKDKRLRSSILVQSPTTTIVVDTGPDFRYQMLRAGVEKLDAVLLTHPHKDHLAGLDDVRAYNFFMKKAVKIYTNSLTEEAVRRDFYYAFADTKYPGIPEFDLHTISNEPFMIGDISVTPILVWHLKMPVLGFRFGDFTYITDANSIDDSEKNKIQNSKVLILNALRKKQHISHFTLGEAIDLAKDVNAQKTWFTHISHQMGQHQTIDAELPNGMYLAYDGLTIELS